MGNLVEEEPVEVPAEVSDELVEEPTGETWTELEGGLWGVDLSDV